MSNPPAPPAPSPKPKPTTNQYLVLGAYALNTFCTFYSMTGKWTNGCTNTTQSDKYFTLVTPPGWAFAIWGLIFLWEGIACLGAFLPQFIGFTGLVVDNWFTLLWGLACLTQSVWPIVFCDSIKTSWAVLLAVWLSLLALQQYNMTKLANLPGPGIIPTKTKVLLYAIMVAPFSLHLGWATAAVTINVNASFVASMASAETLATVAVCSVVFVTAMCWTFGVTGLSWTKNSYDPVMVAGVLWAINAVSKHDVTKAIPTAENPKGYMFPSIITTTLSNVSIFAFVLLAAGVALRLYASGYIKIKKHLSSEKKDDAEAECLVQCSA